MTSNQSYSSAQSQSSGAAPLFNQAKQWLSNGSVADLVGSIALPQSVKDAGGKAVNGFNKLSTTQKVVGGALLVLGVGYFARGGKSRGRNAQADAVNELLYFVNDRIEGYKKAVAESQDSQLRGYYQQLVSQSERFARDLNAQLTRLGGKQQTSTTLKGKVYRRFMEVASTVTGHDEKAILASNIHGEEWAIKAYDEALENPALTGALRQTVERQHAQSQRTHEELKKRLASQL